jgi:predicted ATPase
MTVRRYVLTGAPGAGKTTLIDALRERGHAVVAEAATDVIARRHATGSSEPWTEDSLDEIVELQQSRERAATGDVIFFDRSPLCTQALARHVGLPVTTALRAAVAQAVQTYQTQAFLVRPLGFVVKTAARRISYADSLRFATVHEDVYTEHGFTLLDVPKAPIADRVAIIEAAARLDGHDHRGDPSSSGS